MADAAELDRQLRHFEDLARQQPAERDFRGGHEAQVAVGDAVDLRFRTARNIADPLQDFVARQVRRNRGRKTLAAQHVQGVSLQRQFQQHGVVL